MPLSGNCHSLESCTLQAQEGWGHGSFRGTDGGAETMVPSGFSVRLAGPMLTSNRVSKPEDRLSRRKCRLDRQCKLRTGR
jgi:hypothetical protein